MLKKFVEIYRGYADFSANCGDCHQRNEEPNIPMMTMKQPKNLDTNP